MEPTVYIPVIAALAGAFIGAFIKELSSFYQIRREDKRTLKKVLFNQLDIWYEVRRLYYAPVLTLVFKKLSERFSQEGIPYEVIYSQLEQARPQFVALFRQVKIGEPEKLQPRYQDAVNELAKVDPILAFRISGKAEIEGSLNKLDALADKAAEVSINEADLEATNNLMEQLEPVYEEAVVLRTLTSLEEDIWRVSRRIGIITCFRALWSIHKVKTRMIAEKDPEGDKIIDVVAAQIIEMSNKHNTTPPQPPTQEEH